MMASGKSAKKRRTPAPVVTRRQGLPWLTIGAVVVIVALAAGIFFVVFSKTRENNAAQDALAPVDPVRVESGSVDGHPRHLRRCSTPATAETPASYVDYKAAIHITADQRVAYNRYPPVGGPHDGTWANCNGIVYATAVRTENMVHTLEHGAVWITYNPDTITPEDLATLTAPGAGPAVHHAVALPGAGLEDFAAGLGPSTEGGLGLRRAGQAVHHRAAAEPLGVPGDRRHLPAATFDVTNPPAFDPTPPGADAIPMSGTGGTTDDQ